MTSRTRTSLTSGLAATALAAALVTAVTGTGPLAPAAHASTPTPTQSTLQYQVNALQKTGTVGVVAQSTSPGDRSYATAGVANTATGDPVSPGDRFRVGSITKTFIATVVLQLAGEHRLSLDDTVDHWLPGVVSGNGNAPDRP
ncbi:serine hydrolase domain-containing protein [Streptantibioticus ferralitis]|uniref:serine hydrolase domain-containing protein n=1 Tax=Streptantibioticus ferralitis TaxID=236510 RepID=UPI0027E2BC6C|nr:serine hydrolase domain-containing protein [Streptantibioticus ferralitis]